MNANQCFGLTGRVGFFLTFHISIVFMAPAYHGVSEHCMNTAGVRHVHSEVLEVPS